MVMMRAQGQLEEIKTHRGALELMPDNQRELHWAQLRIYGHLFLQRQQRGAQEVTQAAVKPDASTPELRLALVYF